ncbi:MAG TPA: IS110 family transposase [Stellaceae bacterium]|jgi:transposase|nr:IS110 family transposase [Stellaceae bacterium]
MSENILYVGLDTDKNHIDVAVAEPLPGGEVRYWGKIANESAALDRVIRRLGRDGRQLKVCYEAGPCGYGIYRRLDGKPGVSCAVVAPSMTPRRAGVRVKTNRRDCLSLAKLLRAEELSAIWVPDAAHEAMRDLIRARAAAGEDLMRCRQRIGSFLLRQEIRYAGKPWTKKHRAWLGRLEFAAPPHRLLLGELLEALDQAMARRERLSDHIAELVPSWSLAWLVEALQALRGYRLINAASLVAEIGDPRRFANPRQLMGHLGIVPSEDSSGDKVRRGPLTKTGNRRARKVLIEAAWTYARAAKRVSTRALRQPKEVRAIAEKARHRLSGRYRRLTARGKLSTVAIAAVARESLGFIWAIAHAAAPLPLADAKGKAAASAGDGGGSRSQPR